MGNNTPGSTRIVYQTKDHVPIEYIFFDLKGKNRFPSIPSDDEVTKMFDKCIKEIDANSEQLAVIKQFNIKYRFRFTVLHQRKLAQYKEKYQLHKLRYSHTAHDAHDDGKRKELQEKIKELECNESVLKVALLKLDKFIAQKNAAAEFIQIGGVTKMIGMLDRAVKTNKDGTRTNFSNQIQILKFLKALSDRFPKEYFPSISKIPNYALVILRAFHPINVAVSAYVLAILQDYAWKVQESTSIFAVLQLYRLEGGWKDCLEPFSATVQQSDNILMVYYVLSFVNELLAAVIQQDEKEKLQEELLAVKYDLLIEDVKLRLQENVFRLENCTFQQVHHNIFKHATKTKKGHQNNENDIGRATLTARSTLNMGELQQHLLVSLIGMGESGREQSDEDQEEYLTVYLSESGKKEFNRFVLETLTQIQNYYKLSIFVSPQFAERVGLEGLSAEIIESRKYGIDAGQYIARMKAASIKNGCEDLMLNSLKVLQYFDKVQWRRLEGFLAQESGQGKRADETELLRKNMEEKDLLIKRLIKETSQQKAQIHEIETKMHEQSINNISKLNISHIAEGLGIQGEKKQKISNNGQILGNLNLLPPPPPPPPIFGLPSPPSFSTTLLPPSSTENSKIPNLSLPLPPPPPPPPMTGMVGIAMNNNSSNSSPSLPLPPPPPSISTTNQILPPPPSLSGTILPPLPSMPGGSAILPPPPSLNNLNLPLPPPPQLGSLSLPPPPFSGGLLPPPPMIGGGLPQIPPMMLPGLNFIDNSKQKEKRKPKVQLKACNYGIIPVEKITKTVWEEVDDTKFTLNQQEIQTLFARAQPKQDVKKVQSAIQFQPVPVKKEKVKLLGSDRWRNIEIILTKNKIPEGAMSKALRECTGKFASTAVLESISKILPTEDEESMVRMYEGDPQDLGAPQIFYRELIGIPEYTNRVKSMLFAAQRQEFYYELASKIEQLQTAFVSLKQNYRLHHVLEVALAVGNYLNGTSIKGGAWGFKLDTLDRFEEIKSTDGKMNGGFYVIREVWKKFSFPIFDPQEIQMYQYIAKMPTNQVSAEIGQLRRNVASLKKALQSKDKKDDTDSIDSYCEDMLQQAEQKLQVFEVDFKKMDQVYKQCASFYCEDPQKTTSDEIGKKFYKCLLFVSTTEKVFYEIEQKRKKQESRKATKNEIKFVEEAKKQSPKQQKIKDVKADNPQSGNKAKSSIMQGAILLPKPPVISKEVKVQIQLKQLQKNQEQKQKKFLEQMMKKRTSKIIAFRQSRMPQGVQGDTNIQFLKGL